MLLWLDVCETRKKSMDPISEIIDIIWWVEMFIITPPSLHPGCLWEALWNTQTLAHLGVTSTHLTMAWETQHFGLHSVYPNCSQAIATQWQQHSWWIQQHWSP